MIVKNREKMPQVAVFFHNGLGDGVNGLVLSHHLHKHGWKVTTYQNMLGSMQSWFPHLPVQPYPSIENIPEILSSYDLFVVVHNDTDSFVLKLIQEGKKKFPEKIKVLYFYPSPRIVKEPYYQDCLTDPTLSIAENLRLFCKQILHLPQVFPGNGFIFPKDLHYRKHIKRIAIHPTSARTTRNWPKKKFLKLAYFLTKQGYEPVFIPGEKEGWEDFPVATFASLDLLARFLYECGYFIGNDSGLGHLASSLGIPTLTLCRRKALAKMWAPSFHKGIIVAPSSWIPNIRGLRWRDRYWRALLSVRKAKKAFYQLTLSQ